ncbi:MAG: murein biosynthesis integral membrane protein MurJ [Thermodesulfovibrionia bacterium]|nr:murein biosynthesis integral membrane protein MurJ [Thermodesulfovibrionia bacterium]
MDEKRNVTKAAGQISIATTGSRILGFVRDILLAGIFGATDKTDAFFIAFRIPNLFRELFAEGSMSAAFIPVFTETLTKEGRDDAKKLASAVLAFMICALSVICLLGIIFAPYVVSAIAPGFIKSPDKFSLTVKLTKIMFPFLFFISIAALAKGVLNSLRSFFIPALAPIFLNLAIITSALFFAHKFEVPLVAIGLAVSVGGALQVAIQIPALMRKRFIVWPVFSFAHPGLKKILRLLLPAVVGMGVAQINIFISTIFVSYLSGGSATYLYYAMRLVHLPIGIFGVAMATAVLPSLSEHAAKGDNKTLRDTFSFSLRLLFFITLPAMAGLMALSEPIIHVLLQRGEFTALATTETAYALMFYSSGLWAFVGTRIVASTFYSFQDTKTPVKIAALSVLTNIIFSFVLMGPLRHGGLAFANAIASAVNFVVLFYLLRKRLGSVDGSNIIRSFIKAFTASAAMGIMGFFVLKMYAWNDQSVIFEKAGVLASVIALCIGIYILIMHLMKSEELRYLINMRKRKSST